MSRGHLRGDIRSRKRRMNPVTAVILIVIYFILVALLSKYIVQR